MFIYGDVLKRAMTSFQIVALGNSHTIADAQQMTGLLMEAKFGCALEVEKADVLIYSVCLVTMDTERDFFEQIERLKKEYPYKMVIVVGCFDHTQVERLRGYCLVSSRKFHHIVEVVEELLHDNKLNYLQRDEMPSLLLGRKWSEESFVEIIPITRGCYDLFVFLSQRRGPRQLVSYPIEEICNAVRVAVEAGAREIMLSSVDCAQYGKDIGINLARLLREVVRVPGDFNVLVERMSVEGMRGFGDELINVYTSEKLYRYWNVPLFSGSTRILQNCGFSYGAEDFSDVVNKFRWRFSDAVISTSVLVGFPDETEDDHFKTLSMIRAIVPDEMVVATISSAAKDADEVRKRAAVLYEVFHNGMILRNEKWWGWQGRVFISDKKNEREWIGRTAAYKLVVVEGNCRIGEFVTVRIKPGGKMELRGVLVRV